MKILGYILIAVGFIMSALSSVIDKDIVNWWFFVPSMITGIIGIIVLRRAVYSHMRGEDKISTDIQNIQSSITNVVKNIEVLDAQKNTISVYDIHKRIDELFLDDLDTFAEARESIIHQYDMQSYADLMNHFAAGERYLNRSWSASADGYIDEAHTYIEKAKNQFAITKDHFDALGA